MNDSVLRGFCQKCELPVEFYNFDYSRTTHHSSEIEIHNIIPVWFLSPNQMAIIRRSNNIEFEKWMKEMELWRFDAVLYEALLRLNPFLVAKILKEEPYPPCPVCEKEHDLHTTCNGEKK